MLQFLTQSTWADRIGWVLVHSLWQFAVVALFAGVLQWALERRSATTRYWLLLAAMFIMVTVPVATWFSPWSADASVVAARFGPVVKPERVSPSQRVAPSQRGDDTMAMVVPPEASHVDSARKPQAKPLNLGLTSSWSLVAARIQPWLPQIVLVWLVGVLVAAMRPVLSWHTVRRLRRVGVSSVGGAVQGTLERTASRLGLARAVEVLQSTLVNTPAVVGYFRPAILLPLCVVTGLPETQLELILAHELAHIRRHDYLINLLQTLVETLFFYHPAVWWLSRQIRNERENCCDDVAMAALGSRAEYGRALLAVEELRSAPTAFSLGVRGGSLLARIRRIAGCEPAPRIAGGGSVLCVILVSIAVFAAVTWAATPTAEKPGHTPTTTADAAAKANEQPPVLLTAFGKVVEPAGKPVARATVYLREWSTYRISSDPYNRNPNDILATTHTDAQGAFRFANVPAKPLDDQRLKEIPWDVVVVAKPYAIAWRHLDAAQESKPFTINVSPEAKVFGRITDRQGRPIQNAEIRVSSIAPLGSDWPCFAYADPEVLDLQQSRLAPVAKTDAEGKATIDGLPRDERIHIGAKHPDVRGGMVLVATTDQPQPDVEVTRYSYANGKSTKESEKVYSTDFSLALDPPLPRLIGQVTAADTKKPLGGIKVDPYGGAGGVTGQDGHYVLEGIRDPHFRLIVWVPPGSDYLGRVLFVDVPPEKRETSLDIELDRGAALSGLVVDEETDKGVAGVTVGFDTGFDLNTTTVGGPLPSYDKTDSDGRFRLAVPPGKGIVRIVGPVRGYDLPSPSYRKPGEVASEEVNFIKDVEVIAGKPTGAVEFKVRSVAPEEERPLVRRDDPWRSPPITKAQKTVDRTVEGKVVDPEGKPVAAAEVAPSLWFWFPGEGSPVSTDQDGRFRLRLTRHRLPEESIIAIDRQRRLRGHSLLPQTSPSESQKMPFEIRLAPTGTITGRVVESDKPVVGVQIEADELEPVKGSRTGSLRPNDRYFAKTDENGRFRIPLVEAEHRLHLSVHVEGYAETEGRYSMVQVTAGQTVEAKPFSMIRTDKVVSGTVIDPDGNPVAGASVSARLRSGPQIPRAFTMRPTGEDGRFVIRGVPNLPLTLMAYIAPPRDAKDRTIRSAANLDAEPGQTDVRIVLDPRLTRGKK